MNAIRSVVQAGVGVTSTMASEPVGIGKCVNMATERIDYTVQNVIPMPVPLPDTIRNGTMKKQ